VKSQWIGLNRHRHSEVRQSHHHFLIMTIFRTNHNVLPFSQLTFGKIIRWTFSLPRLTHDCTLLKWHSVNILSRSYIARSNLINYIFSLFLSLSLSFSISMSPRLLTFLCLYLTFTYCMFLVDQIISFWLFSTWDCNTVSCRMFCQLFL
jgi:hypothetical protein